MPQRLRPTGSSALAPPAVGHAQAPLIPPPTVLTLLACHFHGPPHRGSESPSPASYRPRPRSLHSAPCGLGPRSSRACPWLRPSFPQLRPRASRRRFQEATPTTSSRAPRPRPPCPLRSLAPPLEAPLGLQAQCGGGGLCALQARGPAAGRLPGASARSSCLGAAPIRCRRGKRPRQKPD